MKRAIAIDHGNRMTKTPNFAFPTGVNEEGYVFGINSDRVDYFGKSYVLSEDRLPQRNDKSDDENFFILTLFAIGYELKELYESDEKPKSDEVIDLTLLVGLPPLHYRAMQNKFRDFFMKRDDRLNFEFNGIKMSINISKVYVYPQAYAASLTIAKDLEDYSIANIVDIGGYTTDCVQIANMELNIDLCTSIHKGIHRLLFKVNEKVRSQGLQDIPERVIEGIISNDAKTLSNYSRDRIDLVKKEAHKFVLELLADVSRTGMDFEQDPIIFMGGGAILLKEPIKETKLIKKAIFIEDAHANAKGYELFYENTN